MVTLVMAVAAFISRSWDLCSAFLSPFLVFLSPIAHPVNASGGIFEVILNSLVLSQTLGHSDLPLGMRR